eukprot:scaffold25413_cov113-Cylindrotheca_fusiformis.AAC.2
MNGTVGDIIPISRNNLEASLDLMGTGQSIVALPVDKPSRNVWKTWWGWYRFAYPFPIVIVSFCMSHYSARGRFQRNDFR